MHRNATQLQRNSSTNDDRNIDNNINDDNSFRSKLINVPAIEICPTSNYFTLNLGSYDKHPTLRTWLQHGYPISLNTGMYLHCSNLLACFNRRNDVINTYFHT